MANELIIKKELNDAKTITDKLMIDMGFTMSYSSPTEAIAQRGSGVSSAILGPLAGKNNVAVKFALTFSESGGNTTLDLSDAASGLGKAITFTGGTTKKILADVYNTLKEGFSREGLLG